MAAENESRDFRKKFDRLLVMEFTIFIAKWNPSIMYRISLVWINLFEFFISEKLALSCSDDLQTAFKKGISSTDYISAIFKICC